MFNREIADIFEKMGTLLEIKGEIIFKTRAYFKAAEAIASLSEDIAAIKNEGRLRDIPGIGKELEAKIIEYLDTRKMSAYEKLTKEVPETLLDIVNVPSVGPKKAKLFFDELKIKSVPELKKAAETGKLAQLPKFKEKTIENILKGIAVIEQGQKRMNLGTATQVAEAVVRQLKEIKGVEAIVPAGSLRRGSETVGDIDILAIVKDPAKVMDAFVKLPEVKNVNAHGETKSSILTHDNIQVDLRIVEKESFGAALLYFTGSKNFNVKIRQIAIRENKKVNEYGVFSVRGKKEKLLAGKTEEECFKALRMPYIPPELREDIGEEKLFGGNDPREIPKLIELQDIQGDLHAHSTYSDGHNTIAQMAEAARNKGYQYLAMTDHSPRLFVARGVSVEDLVKKKKEIDALNNNLKGFRVLYGTEVEIDTEGNLDYNDTVLSEFDFVIAAIHSGFTQDTQKLTKRVLRAIQNKNVNMLAHPTGVHLGKREPYDLDFKTVCRAAVEHNVFLEINAFPIRLDLNSTNAYYAREQGVKFAINTDSHRIEHLEHMCYGVTVARRAWLTKENVLNTRPLPELLKILKK